jgi:hypothetical protein
MLTSDEIKRQLEDHEKRILKLENLVAAKPAITQKELSIKEFILSKNCIDDLQRALAIGYYLEKYKNYTSFNVEDIECSFREAKEPVPSNINDKVNQNIKKGFIMLAKEKKDNKKAWVLTNSGERYVEGNFEKTK